MGTEREEESDEGNSGCDRGEDESVGQVAEDGLGSDVLSSSELRDKVARVSQLGARASGVGAPSPVTKGDSLTVDLSLQVTDVIPDRGGDLSKNERKRVSVGKTS